MFGFLRRRPTCPVHPVAKAWVEGRLEWLFEQFGPEVFLTRPVVLPTRNLLPDGFDYSDAAVRRLLDRICDLMGVDPTEIALEVTKPQGGDLPLVNGAGAAVPTAFGGLYQSNGRGRTRGRPGRRTSTTKISINSDELLELVGLIGTMAHESAHHRLLGERRLDADAFDHELTTDLTAIYHGFGVFLADSRRIWAGSYDVWPGTDLKKPEYLTPPLAGYALAHQAWLRNEPSPAWAKHLAPDVRASFKQGLRFLSETEDSPLLRHRAARAGPE